MWKFLVSEFKSSKENCFLTKTKQNALYKGLGHPQMSILNQWQRSGGEMLSSDSLPVPRPRGQNEVFLLHPPGCSSASTARPRRSTPMWYRTSARRHLPSGRTAWSYCGTCVHFKWSPIRSKELLPRSDLKSQWESWKRLSTKKAKPRFCSYPDHRGHTNSPSAYFYLNYFLYYSLSDHTLYRVPS